MILQVGHYYLTTDEKSVVLISKKARYEGDAIFGTDADVWFSKNGLLLDGDYDIIDEELDDNLFREVDKEYNSHILKNSNSEIEEDEEYCDSEEDDDDNVNQSSFNLNLEKKKSALEICKENISNYPLTVKKQIIAAITIQSIAGYSSIDILRDKYIRDCFTFDDMKNLLESEGFKTIQASSDWIRVSF